MLWEILKAFEFSVRILLKHYLLHYTEPFFCENPWCKFISSFRISGNCAVIPKLLCFHLTHFTVNLFLLFFGLTFGSSQICGPSSRHLSDSDVFSFLLLILHLASFYILDLIFHVFLMQIIVYLFL